jgi:hypothetical protein
MSNLHTPQRLPSESQADYRKRQAASRRAVDAIIKTPRYSHSPLNAGPIFLGQHTNPLRKSRRALFIAEHGIRQWKRMIQSVRRMFAS